MIINFCILLSHIITEDYNVFKSREGVEIMKLHERFSTLSPIYSGELTNHMPMLITALRLLSVEDSEIEVIAEDYLEHKNIVDLSNSGIENDAFNDEYIRLTNYFLGEINQSNVEAVLKTMLNKNRFSLNSGLFHGLIRIAYGYMENNDLLIAQGLAYFELIKQEMILNGKPVEDIYKAFESLVEVRKKMDINDKSFGEKMEAIQKDGIIQESLFYPVNLIKHKEQAVKFFVQYFNLTEDFFILHVITGYHALHILSQFFDNEEEVFENFFMQASIVMLGNAHNNYEEYTEKGNFVELNKKTPTLRDAHDIKLFLSLCYFYERYEIEELKIAANLIFTI